MLAGYASVSISPCITDISRMIVYRDAVFNSPPVNDAFPAIVGEGHWNGREPAVYGMIDGYSAFFDVGQHVALHKIHEGIVPRDTTAIVS